MTMTAMIMAILYTQAVLAHDNELAPYLPKSKRKGIGPLMILLAKAT